MEKASIKVVNESEGIGIKVFQEGDLIGEVILKKDCDHDEMLSKVIDFETKFPRVGVVEYENLTFDTFVELADHFDQNWDKVFSK